MPDLRFCYRTEGVGVVFRSQLHQWFQSCLVCDFWHLNRMAFDALFELILPLSNQACANQRGLIREGRSQGEFFYI